MAAKKVGFKKTISVFLVFLLVTLSIVIFIIQYQKENSEQKLLSSKITAESGQVQGVEIKSSPIPTQTPTGEVKVAPNNRTVYLGMWTQGFFDPQNQTIHPEVLKQLEAKIGKKMAIAHFYIGWEALDSAEILSMLNAISFNNWRPMISVNPYFFDKCSSNGLPLYKAIASGICDEFIKNIGKNLKQFGGSIFLRFAWEMNIPSMEWQIEKTGSSNEDFVHAWQRMHQIIYEQGATNILWVFSPDSGHNNYRDIYPGDEFVDWIGLDGYNWGTTQGWSRWQSFTEVFATAYKAIIALAPEKPLMISEVNTTDKGGVKEAWYQDMLSTQIPLNFPRIKAVVFYNEDRTVKEAVNWLIDISVESLRSFSRYLQNPIYISSF